MPSEENRARYDVSGLRCPSDLTDGEWALAEPDIPRARPGGSKRMVGVREVVSGMMEVLSAGCR